MVKNWYIKAIVDERRALLLANTCQLPQISILIGHKHSIHQKFQALGEMYMLYRPQFSVHPARVPPSTHLSIPNVWCKSASSSKAYMEFSVGLIFIINPVNSYCWYAFSSSVRELRRSLFMKSLFLLLSPQHNKREPHQRHNNCLQDKRTTSYCLITWNISCTCVISRMSLLSSLFLLV